MANKKIWWGIFVIVLVFGFSLTGCDDLSNNNGYTFEFRIVNNSQGGYARTITNIEFINGSNKNAPVLQTETVNLKPREMSGIYKISGFTEKEGKDEYLFGIRFTTDSTFLNGTEFTYSSAKNKSKIKVLLNASDYYWFENGDW